MKPCLTLMISMLAAVAALGFQTAAALPGAPSGVGTLTAHGASEGEQDLRLMALNVAGIRAGDVVETRVEHIFQNPTDEQLEGTFRFPLPDQSILTGLSMEIDGRMMEGELVEREKARKTYQSIVDSMRDPAILEWDGGQDFKLRIFPIEPRSEKRVVLRFLVPLAQAHGGWRYVYPMASPSGMEPIGAFTLSLDGKDVIRERSYVPTGPVVVPVADRDVPAAVLSETRDDGTYLTVHARLETAEDDGHQDREDHECDGGVMASRVVVLFDTSRSTLEARPRMMEALEALYRSFGEDTAADLVAFDLEPRAHTPGLVFVNPGSRDAISFAAAITPDGASDLGRALVRAGDLLTQDEQLRGTLAHVILIGDGRATWGETNPAALADLARGGLDGALVSAIAIGDRVDDAMLARLTSATGGRVFRPQNAADLERSIDGLWSLGGSPSLKDARLEVPAGLERFPAEPTVIYDGEALRALVRIPLGTPIPDHLTLRGMWNGEELAWPIPLGGRVDTPHVAAQWAVRHIAALEERKAPRPEIVAASLSYGVMSRHTAFLVLESEEAYKRHDIARRAKKRDVRVTGADLEGLGAAARLSPDRIQPGDPEIRIPAPRDARSVVVDLPFGETKIARWDDTLRAWIVRFLIDRETPDGTYYVHVRVTHADGTVEELRLPYEVDTVEPTCDLQIRTSPRRPGVYEIRATQRITAVELDQVRSDWRTLGSAQAVAKRYAHIATDARKVGVRMPDGQVLTLVPIRLGVFRGFWTPSRPVEGPVTIEMAVTDRALNTRMSSLMAEVK